MAASCAACLAPIAKGERFVLSGTEVFHGRCVSGIARSARTRLELKLIKLESETNLLREQLRIANQDLATARRENKALDAVKDHVDREVRVARAARDAAVRDSSYWQERATTAAAETAAARTNGAAQLERLAADLAAARDALKKVPDPEVAKDDRDATEIRFSLLELDKS